MVLKTWPGLPRDYPHLPLMPVKEYPQEIIQASSLLSTQGMLYVLRRICVELSVTAMLAQAGSRSLCRGGGVMEGWLSLEGRLLQL